MENNQLIIAEIAQAHDGSLGILHSYIDALATTGVNAIKFQTHIADAESSIYEPFRIPFSYVDQTRFDYWKRMEFTMEQWIEIKKHCEDKNVEFISSPFSIASIDLLEKLGVKRYKVASGEVSNMLMLSKLKSIGKPVILSSGLSDFDDISASIDYLSQNIDDISILQCTTMYPTPAEKVGLNIIPQLIAKFGIKVGLSDHSGKIYPCLAAAAMGASIFEFHAVFDRRMFGPDSIASLEIDEIKMMVEGIEFINRTLAAPIIKGEEIGHLKKIFGKSLVVNKDLVEGHLITESDLETKKPAGYGIDAKDFEQIIGKALNKNMSKYDFLNYKDFE
jgi:N,N'-diacetyllegionaminate synthase